MLRMSNGRCTAACGQHYCLLTVLSRAKDSSFVINSCKPLFERRRVYQSMDRDNCLRFFTLVQTSAFRLAPRLGGGGRCSAACGQHYCLLEGHINVPS